MYCKESEYDIMMILRLADAFYILITFLSIESLGLAL